MKAGSDMAAGRFWRAVFCRRPGPDQRLSGGKPPGPVGWRRKPQAEGGCCIHDGAGSARGRLAAAYRGRRGEAIAGRSDAGRIDRARA